MHDPAEREAKEEVWTQTVDVLTDAGLNFVRTNIEEECRFPECAWEGFFAALTGASRTAMLETMTESFRDWILHGSEIEETPAPKGRALEVDRFRSLMRDAGLLPSRREQIVSDVKNGFTPAVPYSEQLSNCDLGNHLIWSTFRVEAEDPFEDWSDAEVVRDRLGLWDPDDSEERGLFLLVYRVPSIVDIRYPTIADAYAGSGWNPEFHCSAPNDPWGYTSGNVPEVVHEVIQGEHLIEGPEHSAYAFTPLRIVD